MKVVREHPRARELGHRQWSVGSRGGLAGGPWFATFTRTRDLVFLDGPAPDPRPWHRVILVSPWGSLYLTSWRGRVQLWTPWSGYSRRRSSLLAWHPRYRGRRSRP